MNLRKLLVGIEYKTMCGTEDINIQAVTYDSRKVEQGGMFICIKGYVTDGHKYIDKAINNGAKVVLISDEIDVTNFHDVTLIQCKDTRKAMAIIGNNFYENPSKEFKLFGITGTNGKTTTSFLIEDILKKQSYKTGLIGTIENHIGEKVVEANRTTPESFDLQQLFRTMRDYDVNAVVMEVSSHALELDRVYGTKFEVGIFTNLTQDHLDFHKTMDNYKMAKTKLFKMCHYGIINIDDEAADYIMQEANCKVIYTYSTKNKTADFYAYDIKINSNNTTWKMKTPEGDYVIDTHMLGKFNVYNTLSALAGAYCIGISIKESIKALKTTRGVRGRFETIISNRGFSVIVDYAHTPDGLYNVLQSIREFKTNRVITVFGCGGERDTTKRAVMGKIAGEYSDYCIITSDNPRTEEPNEIIKDIEVGMKETNTVYEKCVDRKQAIMSAIKMAITGDVILIAGKGHENYQIIGTEKHHFDDVEVVSQIIAGE